METPYHVHLESFRGKTVQESDQEFRTSKKMMVAKFNESHQTEDMCTMKAELGFD